MRNTRRKRTEPSVQIARGVTRIDPTERSNQRLSRIARTASTRFHNPQRFVRQTRCVMAMTDGSDAVAVTHHFETEIDPDRVEEWVDANFPKGRVHIINLDTGETIYDDL